MRAILVGEALGSFLLFACVVGSGVMAERLAGGNVAVALIGNVGAIAAMLYVLIAMLGPISGAHFNPAVTIVTRLRLAREHARADLDERALILLDPALTARAAAVERFAADQLRLKPGRGLRVDARAYDAGRRAADAVPLAPGRRR